MSGSLEKKDALEVFKDSMNVSSFIAGSVAGASGVLVGHPFDSLKVRMQVGQNLSINGWNTEVLRQLYRGIMPPLMTVGCVAAINFATYESFKSLLLTRTSSAEDNRTPLSNIFFAGCLSGAVMAPFTSPMGVIKIQLQVAKQMSFTQCVQYMWQRNNSPRAFYRGSLLSMIMESPGRGVYLWTYETVKAICFNPTEMPTHAVQHQRPESYPMYMRAISASVAGIFSWLVIYPFDVIKAKMQLDISRQKYRSTWHCVQTTWAEGGVRGFFRGLTYTLIRAGPVAATILPIYDITKATLDHRWYPEKYQSYPTAPSRSGGAALEDEENNCNVSTAVR